MEWKGVMTLIAIGEQVKCEPLRHSLSPSLSVSLSPLLSLSLSPFVFFSSTNRDVIECQILPKITHLSES